MRTLLNTVGTSHLCQSTKSLRSSPLRGGKSREAGSRSREYSDRLGDKVNTINKRTVGVQRVIKNSQQEDLRAHHLDAPSDNDRTG